MRSVKYILAAGAASILSTAAVAADMPSIMPPPPYYAPQPIVEDFGGWYLRGEIGFSNQKIKNLRFSNEALYSSVTSLNQETNFDAAGVYGVGLGYQFNNWFRGDVTGQYRGSANFKGVDRFRAIGNGITYDGIDTYHASKSELLIMANAYVDLGTWWCVTPFIGAGIGTAQITMSNFTDIGANNLNRDVNGRPFAGGPANSSYATAASASKWNFAWAAHAGLAYKVSPNLTLELAYSYVNFGSAATGGVSTYDGGLTSTVVNFKDITSHDVKIGVRWSLDQGIGYAPPPPLLVRKG